MSLDPKRTEDDDALLDADLLAILGDAADTQDDTPDAAPDRVDDTPDGVDDTPDDVPVPAENPAEAALEAELEAALAETPADQPADKLADEPAVEPADEPTVQPTPEPSIPAADRTRVQVWQLSHLSNASTALRIEEKLRRLPGLSEVSVGYATQQLRFVADNPEARLDQIRRVCLSVDPGIELSTQSDRLHAPAKSRPAGERNQLIAGAVCLAAGVLTQIALPQLPLVSMFILCLSFVLLGGDTLLSALGTLKSGHVFDASTLFSLATLGVIAMGGYAEAAAAMLVYRVGSRIEHGMIERQRSRILSALDLRPESVHRIDNQGVVHTIPAGDAQPGDLLLIRPGDRIPLDGIVRAGESRIDTSAVTGDRTPCEVQPGTAVLSGGVNGTGALQLEVTHALPDSLVSRMADTVGRAVAEKAPTEHQFQRIARIYTPVIALVAVLTAFIPSLVTGDWGRWVHTAFDLLIVAYPGALVLSIPLTYFAALGAGAAKGVLFSSNAAVEALGTVRTVVLAHERTVSAGGPAVQAIVPVHGMNESALLSMAASCEAQSDHPLARCIRSAAHARGIAVVAPSKVQEIPGQGVVAMISGVTVLCGNRSLLETAKVDLSGYQPAEDDEVLVAAGGRFAGSLHIAEAIRPGVRTAIKQLRAHGLTTVLLSRRSPAQAEALSAKLDIHEARTWSQPDEKHALLHELEAAQGPVLYVGDRTPTDVSLHAVMGTDAAQALPGADLALLTPEVQALAAVFDLSRQALHTARLNAAIALASKIVLLLVGFAGLNWLWLCMLLDMLVSLLCLRNAFGLLRTQD